MLLLAMMALMFWYTSWQIVDVAMQLGQVSIVFRMPLEQGGKRRSQK
jgi:hypothetical protein